MNRSAVVSCLMLGIKSKTDEAYVWLPVADIGLPSQAKTIVESGVPNCKTKLRKNYVGTRSNGDLTATIAEETEDGEVFPAIETFLEKLEQFDLTEEKFMVRVFFGGQAWGADRNILSQFEPNQPAIDSQITYAVSIRVDELWVKKTDVDPEQVYADYDDENAG